MSASNCAKSNFTEVGGQSELIRNILTCEDLSHYRALALWEIIKRIARKQGNGTQITDREIANIWGSDRTYINKCVRWLNERKLIRIHRVQLSPTMRKRTITVRWRALKRFLGMAVPKMVRSGRPRKQAIRNEQSAHSTRESYTTFNLHLDRNAKRRGMVSMGECVSTATIQNKQSVEPIRDRRALEYKKRSALHKAKKAYARAFFKTSDRKGLREEFEKTAREYMHGHYLTEMLEFIGSFGI